MRANLHPDRLTVVGGSFPSSNLFNFVLVQSLNANPLLLKYMLAIVGYVLFGVDLNRLSF